MSDNKYSDGIDEIDEIDESRAAGFGKLVDGMLDGASIPPALDADDRALLETATMIVASTQELRLSAERSRSLVDEALEQALTGNRRLSTVPENEDSVPHVVERENTDVINLSRRRADRAIRALPWVVATVAAAAALLLFISRPENLGDGAREHLAQKSAPVYQSSRPADPLIGQITAESAGLASQRLDVIYADRMAGYRELRLGKSISKRSATKKGHKQ
jgi:hypothetical protein